MRFVLDTNIIFSGIYNLDSNAGKVLLLAAEGKAELLSPEHVKDELMVILIKKLRFSEPEVEEIISFLPIKWIEKELYTDTEAKASSMISHRRDVPVLACALSLGVDIISGDKHFLRIKTREIKIWKLKKALEKIK
jgi:predicted nucleic acid-binding protein